MRTKASVLFLMCQCKYFSLPFKPYSPNGFSCSWSSLHRHSVAMANSYAQSLVMPLTTVIRTGKLDLCGPRSQCPRVQGVHADGPAHVQSWFVCDLPENNCTAQVLAFASRLWKLYDFLAERSLVSVVWARISIRQEVKQLYELVAYMRLCPRLHILFPLSFYSLPQPLAKQKIVKLIDLSLHEIPKTTQKTFNQKFVTQLYLLGNNALFMCNGFLSFSWSI